LARIQLDPDLLEQESCYWHSRKNPSANTLLNCYRSIFPLGQHLKAHSAPCAETTSDVTDLFLNYHIKKIPRPPGDFPNARSLRDGKMFT
jgi:hypothetical protein